jgi:hypothetical protein
MTNGKSQCSHSANPAAVRIFDAILSIGLIGGGVLFALFVLATQFANYDDEGYMLVLISQYIKRGHLYSDVFSQYGPFFTLFGKFCFAGLGIPLNHDGGRLVTFSAWIAAAAFGGWTVYRQSAELVVGTAACGALLLWGHFLAVEPMHPQFLVLLLSTAGICVSFWRRTTWMAFALGALGAALILTKINVGAFYAAALGLAMATMLPDSIWRTAALRGGALFGGLLPLLLMRSQLRPNLRLFLAATVCIAATLSISGRLSPKSRFGWSVLRWCATGAALMSSAILVFALLDGATPTALVNGILLWPTRQPLIFRVPLYISGRVLVGAGTLAIGSVVLCAVGMRQVGRFREESGCICFLAGMVAIEACFFGYPTIALACLPLGAIPIFTGAVPNDGVFGRVMLMNWCALNLLQAYPVAGSQVALATTPLFIWGCLSVWDGAGGAAAVLRRSGLSPYFSPAWLARIAVMVLGCTGYLWTARMFGSGSFHQYLRNPASSLQGADWLHLAPQQEQCYRTISENVRKNCDVLFTLPGMASFNSWSGVRPPNGWNMTVWTKTFDAEHQQKILEILQMHQGACVIQNNELVQFWQTDDADLNSPLCQYILSRMQVVAAQDGYLIRIQPQRKSPWIPVTSSY